MWTRCAWFAVVGLGLIATPAEAQWRYHGLSGGMLRDLLLHDGDLYAATDRGVYRQPADEADTTWTPVGFVDRHVKTIEVLGTDTVLAVVYVYTDGQAQDQEVYRTVDGGASWMRVATHVDRDDPEELFNVVRQALNEPQILVAGGFHGLWTSEDLGSTWERVSNASDVHFLAFDPQRPSRMWSGGESNIHWPYLLASGDGGETWSWIQLDLGGDNAVYAMAIDPGDPGVLYIGTEGAVLTSTDGGASWREVLGPATREYFLGLAISPTDPARIYAAGIRNTPAPQRLTLYVSDDRGASWSTVEHGERDAWLGVERMVVRDRAGADVVYLGTRHHGVFSYTATVGTGVGPDVALPGGLLLDQNVPNPFDAVTRIRFVTGSAGHVRLTIFDMLGREVGRLVDGPLAAGVHHVEWRAGERADGFYCYRLEAGTATAARCMVRLEGR